MSNPERPPYKIAGPATWELIRAAYLGGESARVLAERFGVGKSAIRKRITTEKWSKRDYAAALEARGVGSLHKPDALGIAGRFAENYTLPDAPARAADAFAEQPAAEAAAVLERRALAQVDAALAKGRAGDAKTLVNVADLMRKRAAEEKGAAESAASAASDKAQAVEMSLAQAFRYAAYLAWHMVHNPAGAPAIFEGLIAEWRREVFGEGDDESLARARENAKHAQRYLEVDASAFPQRLKDLVDARLVPAAPD